MTYTAEVYYQHDHDEHPVMVSTAGEIDAMVDRLLEQPPSNSYANLYIVGRPEKLGLPDHELGIGVYAPGNVGGLWYFGDGRSWHSQGSRSQRDEVIYFYMGNDTEFPIDSEVSIEVIRQATKEFLASGGERPTCVEWQPHPNPSVG